MIWGYHYFRKHPHIFSFKKKTSDHLDQFHQKSTGISDRLTDTFRVQFPFYGPGMFSNAWYEISPKFGINNSPTVEHITPTIFLGKVSSPRDLKGRLVDGIFHMEIWNKHCKFSKLRYLFQTKPFLSVLEFVKFQGSNWM